MSAKRSSPKLPCRPMLEGYNSRRAQRQSLLQKLVDQKPNIYRIFVKGAETEQEADLLMTVVGFVINEVETLELEQQLLAG